MVFPSLTSKRWEAQNSATCNSKMTEYARSHPSYRHPKGFKKAHVFCVTCSSVPDLGAFSASPINPVQCAHSLAEWKELGIKIKVFRHHSQQLCHPLTNTKAALIVKIGFPQQPHSLIPFPSSSPNFWKRGKVHELFPKLFLPFVELVGQRKSLLPTCGNKGTGVLPLFQQHSWELAGWPSALPLAMSWEVRSTCSFWLQMGTVGVYHQWKPVPRH